MAERKYNDSQLFEALGGPRMMMESKLFQEVFGERLREEVAARVALIEARVREEATAQGHAQGHAQGQVDEAARMIVSVLKGRFAVLPPGVEHQIMSIQDLEVLEPLVVSAAVCTGLPEFIRLLPNP